MATAMSRKCIVLMLLSVLDADVLCGVRSVHAAREPPIVAISDQGALAGVYLTMFRTQRVLAYLGVPYAQPPINERRFIPPVVDNLPRWDGVRNATVLAPDCWQLPVNRQLRKHDEAFASLIGGSRGDDVRLYDEDCLYLNLYIPDGPPPPEGFATIAWLHSGDFATGSASDIDPFQLVFKQKVIVASIAYRLNIFGFLTSMDGEAPGNFGLMDQSAALYWLKKNIQSFGGHPDLITLCGHGSGAVSVSLHLTSGEWSDDLFNRVIIMSGTSLANGIVRTARSYSGTLDRTAHAFGCFRRPTSKLLDCLRNVNAKILIESGPSLEDWGPIIDAGLSNTTTPFVSDEPRALAERGQVHKVTTMIGFTDMEDALDLSLGEIMDAGLSGEMYETLLADIVAGELSALETNDSCIVQNAGQVMDAVNFVYRPMLMMATNNSAADYRKRFIDFNADRKFKAPAVMLATYTAKSSDTYMYRFDIKPRTAAIADNLPDWSGVPHRYDLIYVFGMPYSPGELWDSADKRIADIIMTMWSNFAKFGQPTQVGVYIKWEPFTQKAPGILIIDRSFNMSDAVSLNYQTVQFWNDYYPRVVGTASQCCNVTGDMDVDSGAAMAAVHCRSYVALAAITLLAIVECVVLGS